MTQCWDAVEVLVSTFNATATGRTQIGSDESVKRSPEIANKSVSPIMSAIA